MQTEIVQVIKSNLKKRAEEKNNNTESELKTCLIVQCGGMRASYSMGCLQALEELGYGDSFDYILGSSAGAINGAYFLAKQSKIATGVYSDHIANNKFINYFRLWKVLDVKYLIGILSNGKTALDKEKVTHSRTELMFTTVQYPSAKERTFSIKSNPDDLMDLIKVSATIPALSNEKILVNGEKYIDGAIVDPVPLKSAIELGCTDIVIILTRSRSFRRKPSKFVYDMLSLTFFKDWPKESKDSLFERFSEVNKLYEFIWSHEGDNKSYRVLIVSPEKDALAGLLSKSKKNILRNIKTGYDDVSAVFQDRP